jgi:hypothetical protein
MVGGGVESAPFDDGLEHVQAAGTRGDHARTTYSQETIGIKPEIPLLA